ncbi:MAG: hypothetical protein ACI9JT_002059, partial [Polaribacter sp.]
YNTSYYKKSYIHVVLLCLIAIANNNIVPGQCAEYCASSVIPNIPYPTEYNKHMNAKIIGYHFKIKIFIF